MRARWLTLSLLSLAVPALSQSFDVGSGAATNAIQQAFVDAWLRNGFGSIVGPPLDNVSAYGPTGLIQEFPSTVTSGQVLALIAPATTGNVVVYQVLGPMFSYYSTITESSAGYPTYDTQTCPALNSNPNAGCLFQTFANDYVLFVYSPIPALATSPLNLSLSDPFYTKWNAVGGIGTCPMAPVIPCFGPAISPQTSVTSSTKANATYQQYDNGVIYNITSGVLSGRILAIPAPIWNVYYLNGQEQGALGLPVTDMLLVSGGLYEQTFEGGAIEYNPTTGMAQLRPPIYTITLSPSGSVQLNSGATLTVTATATTGAGVVLTDRVIGWDTSNSQVVSIQASNGTATLKAGIAGTATITASAEGKTSAPLTVTVISICCSIGEGIPTQASQTVFQNAVTQAGLPVQLPAATPAVPVGNGYIQQLVSSSSSATPYLVALQNGSLTAYIVTGPILTQYLAMGGPAGSLGYPTSDATPGGRQSFQQGTLAGNPVQLVSGAILTEWAMLGYETGSAGSPTGAAAPFQTFRGTSGLTQTFQTALIVSSTAGPLAGQTYWVSGLVLAQYTAASGPSGNFGAPTDNEHNNGPLRWQDFEGGYISYTPGGTSANPTINPRQPVVTVSPATVVSGGTVQIVAGGFSSGAVVRVSQTGQPDFQVTVTSGTYAWNVLVPSNAASGTVTVTVTNSAANVSATATYTVHSVVSAALTISVVSGDQQTGAPGATLAQPLVAIVQDSSGNPAGGQTVTFAASPGGSITPTTAVSGPDGTVRAMLRMPPTAGVALATAAVSLQVVTFSARSVAFSIANFTPLTQNVSGTIGTGSATILQKGALLTSAASILQYYQSQGLLPSPNGLAGPVGLNQYLTSFCASGTKICDGYVTLGANGDQTVNLWRVGGFAANNVTVSVESTSLNSLRDLIVGGSPVLLALSLNGQASTTQDAQGSHFVVATGISSTGDLVIADPDPVFNQSLLGAYTVGFKSSAGDTVQGVLSGAVRLLPQPPSASAFLLTGTSDLSTISAIGPCATTLGFPDTAAASGVTPSSPPGTLYFSGCPGLDPGPYQINLAQNESGTFTVLSAASPSTAPVNGTAAFSLLAVRSGSQWALAPMATSIAPSGVINAASFTPQIAPGGLVSIFGTGFYPGSATPATVQVNGENTQIFGAFPFQINALIPADIPLGTATITVTVGSAPAAQQTASVSPNAPAIFSIGPGQAAITNQDNSLNTPSNPALRGSAIVIYGTGFGAVTASGKLNTATTPVTSVIGGTQIPTAFAGLTPGFVGLYQANVILPASLPPGLALPLFLQQGSATSNTVNVAVQ